MKTTKKLTTSALLIALATVLMWVSKLIPAPWLQGGSVTLASMVPVILIGIVFGTKWGLCTSISYAILQMIFGFYPPPAQTVFSFVAVVFLDYIFAFGFLGLSGFFFRLYGKKHISAALSAFTVTLIRYICHIISGILIWGIYAGENQSLLAYSIIYNGTYMVPEIIISTIVTYIIFQSKIIRK